MGGDDHDFDAAAAAAFIMKTQLASFQRATHVRNWLQMILWGGLYCVIGLVVLVVGAGNVSRWLALVFLAAVLAVVGMIIATRWGFAGPRVRVYRLQLAVFLAAMLALVAVAALMPDTVGPIHLPRVWFVIIVSCFLVALWVGIGGAYDHDAIRLGISFGLFVTVIVAILLLFLSPTDRIATVFVVVTGALSVLAAIPVRLVELRAWQAQHAA